MRRDGEKRPDHDWPSSPADTPTHSTASGQIVPNRKEIGVAFKKEAKAVTDYLEGMAECDAMELKVSAEGGAYEDATPYVAELVLLP